MKRVLVLAHGHPDFSKGGAEHAAHHLFTALRRRPDCESWFVGRNGTASLQHTGTPFATPPGENELLFSVNTDGFDFSSSYPRFLTQDFADLLRRLQPEVVHFHHYVNLGIEMLRVVRNTLPQARVVVTLHEFLAICNRNGQMMKTNGSLCYRSTPAECHLCMPHKSPQDYALRKLYVQALFESVDLFISPSEFLRSRYIEWGIPPQRIIMLENGLPHAPAVAARPVKPGQRRTRFAYFGQITPFKGLEVLLQAFEHLPAALRSEATLEIHGGGQHVFKQDFRERIDNALAAAPATVRYFGPYAPRDVARLMSQVDWVVVPSVWWENSPLVIQEAYRHGLPVISSDIGGMAEKVPDGVKGLNFRVGSAGDLAERMQYAIETEGLWERLHANIRPPLTEDEMAQQHLDAYAAIRRQGEAA